MTKKKLSRDSPSRHSDIDVSPSRAKLALIVFGLGPLILMGCFLVANGFFGPPGN